MFAGSFRSRRAWLGRGLGLAGVPLAVLAIVAAACTGGGLPRSIESPGSGDDGLRFIAYQGEDVLGGKEIEFTSLVGRGKPVVLNFWAGLCPPCREEMPSFQRVYNEHKGQFILLGVDIGPFIGLGSRNDARRLLKELKITYPTAYATSARAVREYNVRGMPTTIFYTPDGKVFDRHTGFLTEGQLRQKVTALLAASRPGT